jgi:hypothetical protein
LRLTGGRSSDSGTAEAAEAVEEAAAVNVLEAEDDVEEEDEGFEAAFGLDDDDVDAGAAAGATGGLEDDA